MLEGESGESASHAVVLCDLIVMHNILGVGWR